jgi:glutaminase
VCVFVFVTVLLLAVFKWRDSETTVTITFNVAASTKKGDLDIGFNSSAVRVALKGQAPLLEGPVYGALVPAKCKASIKKDVVTVTLHKQTPADWPSLLSPAAVATITASPKEPRDSLAPSSAPLVATPASKSPTVTATTAVGTAVGSAVGSAVGAPSASSGTVASAVGDALSSSSTAAAAEPEWTGFVVVLFDYDALDPVELTIREGQVLENVVRNDSGWWKGTLNGVEGLIPFNFCVPIAKRAALEAIEAQKRVAGSGTAAPPTEPTPNAAAAGATAPVRPPRKGTAGVNVLAAPGGMDELTAKLQLKKKEYTKGEPVVVLAKSATLRSPASPGLRPAQATSPGAARRAPAGPGDAQSLRNVPRTNPEQKRVEDLKSSGGAAKTVVGKGKKASEKQRTDKKSLGRNSVVLEVDKRPIAVALYDYEAEEKGELSFHAGDKLLVNVKDESGWWQVESTASAEIGWVPADFLSIETSGKLPVKSSSPLAAVEAPRVVAATAAPAPAPTPVAPAPVRVSSPAPTAIAVAVVAQGEHSSETDDNDDDDDDGDDPPPPGESAAPTPRNSLPVSADVDDAAVRTLSIDDDDAGEMPLPPTPFHALAGTIKLTGPLPQIDAVAVAKSPLTSSVSERRAPQTKPPPPKSAVPVKASEPGRWPSGLPPWSTVCERLQQLCDAESRAAKSDTSARVPLATPRLRSVESVCDDTVAFAICSVDGVVVHGVAGAAAPPRVTLQGCAWPFVWAQVVGELGLPRVRALVSDGPNPAASAQPRATAAASVAAAVPLPNAMQMRGAVALLDAHQATAAADARIASLLDALSAAAGAPLQCSLPVYLSAREHALRDRSAVLTHVAAAHPGAGVRHADDLHDLYQQVCSVEVTLREAAALAATLASGGVCATSGERVLSGERVSAVNAMLLACGLNDASDAHRQRFAGVPAKSGIGGLLLAAVPDACGLALWSPRLTKQGVSKRAYAVLENLLVALPALAKQPVK